MELKNAVRLLPDGIFLCFYLKYLAALRKRPIS